MKKDNLLIICIIIFLFIITSFFSKPSSAYKDADDLAAKARKKIDSLEYISYTAKLSLLGRESANIKVFSNGEDYRFESSYIITSKSGQKFETEPTVALSRTGEKIKTRTSEIEDFTTEDSLYKIIEMTNFISSKNFNNDYVTLGKKDKVGNYECIRANINLKAMEYNTCISEQYGISVQTTLKTKGKEFMAITLSDISTTPFDEALLEEF